MQLLNFGKQHDTLPASHFRISHDDADPDPHAE